MIQNVFWSKGFKPTWYEGRDMSSIQVNSIKNYPKCTSHSCSDLVCRFCKVVDLPTCRGIVEVFNGLTCDVGGYQFRKEQNYKSGRGLPRRHTLFPGKMMFPWVTHKLDPFGHWHCHMDLRRMSVQLSHGVSRYCTNTCCLLFQKYSMNSQGLLKDSREFLRCIAHFPCCLTHGLPSFLKDSTLNPSAPKTAANLFSAHTSSQK